VISHAILAYNAGRGAARRRHRHHPVAQSARDGGIKYNPPHGGPADTDVTGWIEQRANALMARRQPRGQAVPYAQALAARAPPGGFRRAYVADLARSSTWRRSAPPAQIGVDPLGGAAVAYWEPIAEKYGLDIEVVNRRSTRLRLHDPGPRRQDPHGLLQPLCHGGPGRLKDRFDVAWGNDPDVDRHGIVTPSLGLLNPNHYLAVAIDYLLTHRPHWPQRRGRQDAGVQLHDRPRGRRSRARCAGSAGGLQVVRRRPARRQLLLRRRGERRAPPSCAATARPGPPTRTASSSACSPPRSPPSPARTRASYYQGLAARTAPVYVRIDARPPGAEGRLQQLTGDR
jgi:hypothetical protein